MSRARADRRCTLPQPLAAQGPTTRFLAHCQAHKSATGLPWLTQRASMGAFRSLIRLKRRSAATNQLQAAAGDHYHRGRGCSPWTCCPGYEQAGYSVCRSAGFPGCAGRCFIFSVSRGAPRVALLLGEIVTGRPCGAIGQQHGCLQLSPTEPCSSPLCRSHAHSRRPPPE